MKPEHRAIEDLEHQLRGPLFAAIARLNNILREKKLDTQLEKEIRVIRGLCRKASQVAQSARLFVSLNTLEPTIHLKRIKLQNNDLMKILVECVQDNEILISPERHIRIIIDQNSFQEISEVFVDPELVRQAINNLLDNAVKYSFPATIVSISAKRTKGTIRISVTNRGIPINPQEVSKCMERGWRGEWAMLVTGEGSGIGLWVADKIMKAHQGSVSILPTDGEGKTQVQLVFPVTEESS